MDLGHRGAMPFAVGVKPMWGALEREVRCAFGRVALEHVGVCRVWRGAFFSRVEQLDTIRILFQHIGTHRLVEARVRGFVAPLRARSLGTALEGVMGDSNIVCLSPHRASHSTCRYSAWRKPCCSHPERLSCLCGAASGRLVG